MEYKNKEKILLILDIDETLIFASNEKLERNPDFNVFHYQVYKRPYLDDFFEAIKNNFLLAIWSSASDDYVEKVVEQIIPEGIDLEFVWGRSRATYKRNIQLDELGYFNDNPSSHYHYVKSLKKVKKKGFQIEKILIVDDTPHKSMLNYGNAIYPKEYKGEKHDDELLQLAKYLKTIKGIPNVRRIEKRNWRITIKND